MPNDKNEKWIADQLIPQLVKNGKFALKNEEKSSENKEIVVKSCEINQLSAKDAFMLTLCYKVKLILTDASGQNENCVGLVVKITPNVEQSIYDVFLYDFLFKNEIIAYEEMFPSMGCSDRYSKYYYSHVKDGEEAVIALGDFTCDGWSMSTMSFNLSLDHILLAVKAIGKFHGEFYALKHTNQRKFNDIKDTFLESRFYYDHTEFEWDTLLKTGPKRALRCVRDNNNVNANAVTIPEGFLRKLEKVLADPFNYQRKMVKPTEPLAIICHGDYLRNNIAFCYSSDKDDQNEPIPLKAMIFDFQTLRYSSPMVDLATFMSNSTGVDVRSQHFPVIFRTYHDEVIGNYCKATGVKLNDVPGYLSYGNFLREYAVYMPFGLSIAASFLPVLHTPSEFDICRKRTLDEILAEGYGRGGASVDRELCALVVDIYNLYQEMNLDLEE